MDNKKEISNLIQAGCSENVIAHIEVVTWQAIEIARKIANNPALTLDVDIELVRLGALYHDIGRAKTHGLWHAIEGVKIAKEYGLADDVLNIIERHIGSGLTADEAKGLGLPERDFLPETVEEKVVSYADNLVMGDKLVSFEEAVLKFKKRLGPDNPAIARFVMMHEEISLWCAC